MSDKPSIGFGIDSLCPRSLKYLTDNLISMIKDRLWLKVMVGMVLGIIVGIAQDPSVSWVEPKLASTINDWLAFSGKLFLALIQMIVIPPVFASNIRGLLASEDLGQFQQLVLE